MEYFQKAKAVRLRSRHGKYLWADDDEVLVSQNRNGSKRNSVWTVELDEETSSVRLKSCYDCYLTATDVPFLLGMTGKKVLQMKLVDLESSVDWKPIKEGLSIKLKIRYGNYLRANGTIPPWRNSVTHDVPHRTMTQDWILWEVETVENISGDSSFEEESSSSKIWIDESPSPKVKLDERVIYYAVADDDDDGEAPESFESEFVFKGHELGLLTQRLKEETGIVEDIIPCSLNHINNKLYPLRLQLPPLNTPMYVVVVKASSRMAKSFQELSLGSELHANKSFDHSFSKDSEQARLHGHMQVNY